MIRLAGLFLALLLTPIASAQNPLDVGIAGHAFDHLSGISEQAETAVASGANIIYVTGVGSLGYAGLPATDVLDKTSKDAAAYLAKAKTHGIRLAIGYVCATSIVNLNTFDKHWTPEFKAQFKTPPAEWLQRDSTGKPLPSWYGGDYLPACMNNPDWRTYEKAMVRRQIEDGCDGIFFDNPTVHEKGCYCEYCIAKFIEYLQAGGMIITHAKTAIPELKRHLAVSYPREFEQFRCTIARDFLAEMRTFARSIDANALITCNNSLNTPEMFFKQCKMFGYNIFEMSQVEDLVVVEDMATQPRTLADGRTIEYGAMYEALHAISHGKPVVACVLADGDYHAPPHLVRLAMAEAAAHGASYMSWPTWPAEQRERMAATIRPQADFLREHAGLLNATKPSADVLVFLPFRRWQDSPDCKLIGAAQVLAEQNIQYRIVSEDSWATSLADFRGPVLIESGESLLPAEAAALSEKKLTVIPLSEANWLDQLRMQNVLRVSVEGPPTVRAIARSLPKKQVIHLLNMDIRRINSFEDEVHAASNIKLRVASSVGDVRSVRLLSADKTSGDAQFQWRAYRTAYGSDIDMVIPQLQVSALIVIE